MERTIWIDLDNSPHVPLFRPIIKELAKREVNYLITSRKFAQTEELLKFWQIPHKLVGEHGGKYKINKIINLLTRSYQLTKRLDKKKGVLALSHGSRTQLIASWKLGINSVLMLDYEYTESKIFNYFSSTLLIPKYIPDTRLVSAGINLKKVIRYGGFKEELYLSEFIPDINFRNTLDLSDDQILIVIRPPSMTTNYHDSRSENLLIKAIKLLAENQNSIVLIINRTAAEKEFILRMIPAKANIKFLEKTVDGLQLLFAADISISGGGTMNREAALLGTAAYSIFTGRRPYLDEYLQQLGKLSFIESVADFNKIPICRSIKKNPQIKNDLVGEITNIILDHPI